MIPLDFSAMRRKDGEPTYTIPPVTFDGVQEAMEICQRNYTGKLIIHISCTDRATSQIYKASRAVDRLSACRIAAEMMEKRVVTKRRTAWWYWQARKHVELQPNAKRYRSRREKHREVNPEP